MLNEFLLDRVNFEIMITYINDVNNLITIMKVLRTPQAIIQYEAFHVFKVFVANPEKTPEVTMILKQNSEKLIVYLLNFLPERGRWMDRRVTRRQRAAVRGGKETAHLDAEETVFCTGAALTLPCVCSCAIARCLLGKENGLEASLPK